MYHIDRQYGTVVFLAESGLSSDAEQLAHLAELRELALEHQRKRARFVLVVDTRNVEWAMPVAQRKRLANWLSSNEQLAGDIVIQTVFIVQSSTIRGTLATLERAKAVPPKLTLSGSFREALARTQMALMAEGLPLHPALAHRSAERRIFGNFAQPTRNTA